jgi:hypothetical protein
MPAIEKEELQSRAQLVRLYEASCKIEYPTVDELNFRLACMKSLGVAFNMREVRNKEITGPVKEAPARPNAGGRK